MTGSNEDSKWCSYHRTTTHGDAECKAQKKETISSGSADIAYVSIPEPSILPPVSPTTTKGDSFPTVGGSQQPVLTKSAFSDFSFGTSTPPQSAGHSEYTFRLFSVCGGVGRSASLAAAPLARTANTIP